MQNHDEHLQYIALCWNERWICAQDNDRIQFKSLINSVSKSLFAKLCWTFFSAITARWPFARLSEDYLWWIFIATNCVVELIIYFNWNWNAKAVRTLCIVNCTLFLLVIVEHNTLFLFLLCFSCCCSVMFSYRANDDGNCRTELNLSGFKCTKVKWIESIPHNSISIKS